jgi:hypothetical protein
MLDNQSLEIKNLLLIDSDDIDKLLECRQEDEITNN